MHTSQPSVTSTLVIYALALGILVWRFSRPQKMAVWRLWFMPLLLLILTAYNLYLTPQLALLEGTVAPPAWQTAFAALVGLAAGIPLGMVRGRHSDVSLGDRPNTIYIKSSMVVLFVWLGAFALKALLRYVAHGSPVAIALGDGLLVFAISALITSYVMIWQKYQTLRIQTA